MPPKRSEPEATEQQSIEQLQDRYQQLSKRKIQAETSLDHARGQLSALQKEAREKFGTDDVAELRAKLDEMKLDNERKRRDYQVALDSIETELGEVEARFSASEAPNASGETS